MKKSVFLTGVIILILATVLFSWSGSNSGNDSDIVKPLFPFLNSINSIYFVLLGLVGLITAIFGLRNKKK